MTNGQEAPKTGSNKLIYIIGGLAGCGVLGCLGIVALGFLGAALNQERGGMVGGPVGISHGALPGATVDMNAMQTSDACDAVGDRLSACFGAEHREWFSGSCFDSIAGEDAARYKTFECAAQAEDCPAMSRCGVLMP